MLAAVVVGACLAACGGGAPAVRNVVVVSLDTTRADRLGVYGHPARATPRIDALARDGLVFERAYTTNPLTLPAHSTMLTGTIPPVHGVHRNNARLGEASVTLAERLRARGMATAGFVGAAVLVARFGIAQGFDTWGDELADKQRPRDLLYSERPAEQVSDEAIAWLEAHGAERPFLLFAHYFDPHQPYVPPEPFASAHPGDPYTGEIAYADHHVGRLFDALARLGLADSTLIVVTADHGQALGDRGEETHGFFASESVMRVPLIVRGPGVSAGRRAEPVGLVDIVPTVLAALGLERPAELDGHDLRSPPPSGRTVYLESIEPTMLGCGPIRGLVEGDWKVIATAQPELYDLVRDPAGATNLAAREPERLQQLTRRLDTLLADRRPLADAAAPAAVDDEMLAHLQALGYVTEAPVAPVAGAVADDPKVCFAAYKHYVLAREALDAKRFDDARREVQASLAERPGALNPRLLLGTMAIEQERWPEAVAELGKFLDALGGDTTRADLAHAAARAHNNLGIALDRLERPDDAVREFTVAARLAPQFAEAHNNLGSALLAQDRLEESMREFRAALDASPRMGAAHRNLARALAASGRPAEAIRQLDSAVALVPDDAQLRVELAWLLVGQHDPQRAVLQLRTALAAAPGAAAANGLAWLLATCDESDVRDPSEAVTVAERARDLSPGGDPAVLDTLAAAYAAAGRFPDAIATAETAERLARGKDEPAMADDIATRLASFRRGEPYRRPCGGG